jgi:hypothetical protein
LPRQVLRLFRTRNSTESTWRGKERKNHESIDSIQENDRTHSQCAPAGPLWGLVCPDCFRRGSGPDGGYPGGNTAEGQNALFSLTTGGYNTAVGFFSLRSIAIGQFNTAVGAGTLLANTADQNTATGAGALLSNTTGSENTANGAFTLFSNTIGNFNTAIGARALLSNIDGGHNTAIGVEALRDNTGGGSNVAIGDSTLFSNTTGVNNVAIGDAACFHNTEGNRNVAIGAQALNTNTTGDDNIAIGIGAGGDVVTGNNNICIGAFVGGFDVSNSCFIGNIRGAQVGADAVPVSIDSSRKLGTVTSSKRFKLDIKPMNDASRSIVALKPVTFRYKSDKTATPQFGLIAEDVAEVNPALVIRDEEGKPYTVRHEAVNAMLLNEFLKEHKKVEEQQARIVELELTVAQQKKRFGRQEQQIAALISSVQKLGSQIEISRVSAPVAASNQ